MLPQHPQGRLTSWLARAFGRAVPALSLSKGAPAVPATKFLSGPCFAFDRLGSPAWAPRDYAAFAREGFMQNAIVYRSVRMIAEAAASVPLLLYEGADEIAEHPLLDLIARPNPAASTPDLLEAWYGLRASKSWTPPPTRLVV